MRRCQICLSCWFPLSFTTARLTIHRFNLQISLLLKSLHPVSRLVARFSLFRIAIILSVLLLNLSVFLLTVSCDVTSNMVSYEAQQKADQVSGQQTSLHILLSISFTAMQ